jgi:formylmethanofuran dehydrogenase subunit E
MKLKSLIIVSAALLVGFSANAQVALYKKAGEIKIIDHKAHVAGTQLKDKDVFTISLEDVGKVDGHICGCNTAGFLITKNVLKQLFPGETPIRNSMKISVSEYNRDMIDAISLITGNRLTQYAGKNDEFVVDKSLAGKKGTTVLLFERRDNGKKVQVVLDKNFLLTKEEMVAIMTIKPKIAQKQATPSEMKKYASVTQAIVKREIMGLPENAITYKEL